MKILGINSVYHETAAALIVDGTVRCAVEEERFNRYKHGAEARVDNPYELPIHSIRYCLQQGQIQGQELDAVCFSFDPSLRQREWQSDPYALPGDWGHPDGEAIFQAGLMKVQAVLSANLGTDISNRFHWISHHLAHAASTYYPAAFEKAGILVVDGIGEQATTLLAYGEGTRIDVLGRFVYPDSIGFLWEKISNFLGFSEYDATKVMGLAAYGNPLRYKDLFHEFISYNGDGSFYLKNHVLQFRQPHCNELTALFGPVDTDGIPGHSQKSRDIAATLQLITNEVMLSLVNHLYQLHPCDALCLAGGVALNCQTNWVVKEQGPYQRIYIPTAPHDAGTAVGAALYYHYHRQAAQDGQQGQRQPVCEVMSHPYTGPGFSDKEICQWLQAHAIAFRQSASVEEETARLIAAGKIVGWFQGDMEFGPRALGNRSLVADPRNRNVRELLNHKVKHREEFRPFAPSVLEECSQDWFELGKPSESYRYMLFACPVKKDKVHQIPAVIHVDDTARIQMVNKQINPKYHKLISHFAEITGVPLVLNTSFNDSEPIVCSPQDALNTFCKTKIDALVLGDCIIER